MIARSHDVETFDTLLGDSNDQEQLPLEHVSDAEPDTPNKKETRGKKRKSDEKVKTKVSEYQKKQEELARRMEESAREETLRREAGDDAGEVSSVSAAQVSHVFQPPEQSPAYFGATPGYQTPGYETPGYPPPADNTPGCATPQFSDNNSSFQGFNTTGQKEF